MYLFAHTSMCVYMSQLDFTSLQNLSCCLILYSILLYYTILHYTSILCYSMPCYNVLASALPRQIRKRDAVIEQLRDDLARRLVYSIVYRA